MSFSQKTVRFSDGEPDTAIWREFIRYPDQFRIDFTDTSGNINLYRNDSIYVFRDHQLVFQDREIQAFLLIEGGIYFLPVEQVLRGLAETGIDTRPFGFSSFEGHRIMIIGAGEGDLSRPQMWIDPDRKVIVRQILKTDEGSLLDVRLRNFEYLQGCWVTSSLDFYESERRVQSEEYFDIKINPPVDPSIFSPSRCLETYWYAQ